ELRDTEMARTFALGARGTESYWTSVLGGTDGFFYLSNRCLFEAHRGGEVSPHTPKWTNIRFVRPGPASGILLQEADNKDGDVGKLYFPADGTYIHIEPELFDDREYDFIYWSAPTDRFVVLGGKILAVPTSSVLALPRYNVRTGRKIKN